ncbi:MAG: hypothetical protein AAGA54_18170 [Myxococcota bacterium]
MKHPTTRTTLSALFLAACVAVPTASASVVPYTRMAADDLAPDGYDHHPVLRIDQDFHPNDDYEISIDAWVDQTDPDALAAVRMWWLDTADADARSPFGKGVRRHIDIDYVQGKDAAWDIRITQGRKRFVFAVQMNDAGTVGAFADVRANGEVIEDCRVQRSRLVAKKVLGIAAGLKRLDVTCIDDEGTKHRGSVVGSKVRR